MAIVGSAIGAATMEPRDDTATGGKGATEEMLIGSWADSPWQTLILAGALDAVPMQADLISYAVPSYYGMVVAVYEPAPPAAKP